ncbi:hypothetical protein KAR91_72870 [Candidatus Pacearchaeota archaeon]|nr:hypothetical protein [Candidatus Pacearchaeota archaeon]
MPKILPNEELFEDDGKTIRFIANNGTGKAINLMGKDISVIFSELTQGSMANQEVENVLICCVKDIDDEPIKETEKVALINSLSDKYGAYTMQQVAFVLLSAIMLGKKKCSKITIHQRREAIAAALLPGHSTNSTRVGLLWAGNWISSTVLACLISSCFVLLIA